MFETYSTLFYPKNSNKDKLGKIPIYLRITVNVKRSELSIKRKILFDKWNSETGSMRGKSAEAGNFNRYLNEIRIDRIYEDLTKKHEDFSAETIRNIYSGKNQKQKMLLEIFQSHNDQVDRLVGKDFAAGTA